MNVSRQFCVAIVLLFTAIVSTMAAPAGQETPPSSERLRQLQRERVDVRKEQLAVALNALEIGKDPLLASAYMDSVRELAEAELEIAETKGARIAIVEKLVKEWKRYEEQATELQKGGLLRKEGVGKAKAARLKAEIELEKLKAGKETPPTTVRLRQLQREHVEVQKEQLDLAMLRIQVGGGTLFAYVEVAQELAEAELEVAETKEARLAIVEKLLKEWKRYEEHAIGLQKAGLQTKERVAQAKAARLKAEIELEKLKAGKETPPTRERLRQLQRERVEALKEGISGEFARVNMRGDPLIVYLDPVRELAEAELEVAETKEARLAAVENMVNQLTWCEEEMVRLQQDGRQTKLGVSQAKAARLKAEIELEKLKLGR